MGGKGGSQEQEYVHYWMSWFQGFCNGPVDRLTKIKMKDKRIWPTGDGWPDEYVDTNTDLCIALPGMFGGAEREGGAVGRVDVMLGTGTQEVPGRLQQRIDPAIPSSQFPGHRYITCLAFTGNDQSKNRGFYVSANSPQVPPIEAEFVREPKTNFDPVPERATIQRGRQRNANPAHMIYEVLTDDLLFMGADPSVIDEASFISAAQTLAQEQFGLSMIWTRESPIENFVQEILNHISAMLFFHPKTGKATLKLLRADYDYDTLPVIDESDGRLLKFRRKLWGETINEVIIEWTNPETEETETVTYQDIANISIQQAVVSEKRNYYGIRDQETALLVGKRDISQAAYPLASAELLLDRRYWSIVPGDMYRLDWAPYGISGIAMRVMEVDYGEPDDAAIRVKLAEDTYGRNVAEFVDAPPPTIHDPPTEPDWDAIDPLEATFFAAPYPLLQRANEVDDQDYPGINIGVLAGPPDTAEATYRNITTYELYGFQTNALGVTNRTSLGDRRTVARGRLTVDLVAEVTSTIGISDIIGKPDPTIPSLLVISDLDDEQHEIAMLEAGAGTVDGVPQYTIRRGLYDTVPNTWAASTRIWFVDGDFNALDLRELDAFVTHNYRLRPWVGSSQPPIAKAPKLSTDHVDRPYLPFRPADCEFEGTAFGSVDLSAGHEPRDWTLTATWSTRNRTLEDAVSRSWDDANVAPEANQQTALRIISAGHTHEYLVTGDTFDIPLTDGHTYQDETVTIEYGSERDGYYELQAHQIDVTLYRKGYGSDWGYFFGGWPD